MATDNPKIYVNREVRLVEVDTLPAELTTGHIYRNRTDESNTLALAGGETLDLAAGGGGGSVESALYQYREAVNISPQTITSGSWQEIELGTSVHEGVTGASLASNRVTLPAGTYLAEYSITTHETGMAGASFEAQGRLYNVTDAAAVADSGTNMGRAAELTGSGNAAIDATVMLRGATKFTLAAEKVIALEARSTVDIKLGLSSPGTWESVVGAELRITKFG